MLAIAVGLVDSGGADHQRGGAAAAVAEPAGDGAEVDAGGDELGRGVVAQRMQAGAAEFELGRHPPVLLAQRARGVGGGAIGRGGKQEGVTVEGCRRVSRSAAPRAPDAW